MNTDTLSFWQRLLGRSEPEPQETLPKTPSVTQRSEVRSLDIASNDPFLAYVLSSPGVVEVDRLKMDSPTLDALREEGVRLAVPLVSQGELIGLLNLGPRMSEQQYSTDDKRLLQNLATQAAPALRVAQLARQQQIEARARERLEQELRVARIIQQTLLPQEVPQVSGWKIDAYWQPARAVGGDFYDFIKFPDGKLGLIIADVTDKGVPAALVMATTRSILRAAAERLVYPGEVLKRTNDLLHPDIPPKMFVTCLYALLDPATGHMHYANAGHDLPYLQRENGVEELRATGMPLGLMPEMDYEQKTVTLETGDTLLLYSDGLVEAHNDDGEMFGFPRLQDKLAIHPKGNDLITHLLADLDSFTDPDWEQEDDVTLLTIGRVAPQPTRETTQTLAQFEIPSQPGQEREAKERVAEAIQELGLPSARVQRLETAVAEATMNAMEHGNKFQEDVPVRIEVLHAPETLLVRITDQGRGQETVEAETPDLEAKLAGLQSPRGWGLFLIENMVDKMNLIEKEDQHTIELILQLKSEES